MAKVEAKGMDRPQDQKAWVDKLYSDAPTASMAIICPAGTVSNRGRIDNKEVGSAAACFTIGGEQYVQKWCMGSEVSSSDVSLFVTPPQGR